LINAGSAGIQRFSIDGHNMTIMANDYVPVVSIFIPCIQISKLTLW